MSEAGPERAPTPTSTPTRTFVLAAGGTGGHLFPAQALAEQLRARGAAVHLASDRRADAFAGALPGTAVSRVRAGRLGGGVLQTGWGLLVMLAGLGDARRLLRRLDPEAVIGFGGYPSVPTMLMAARLGFPTVIHEQNAVLGRANRFLAKRMKRICTGFADTARLPPAIRDRAVYTGNPVRPAIRLAATPYRAPAPGLPIELLILGGSQGARIFADVVPAALAALPSALRSALRVSQQARPEDVERVTAQLRAAGIAAEVSSFFTDVPERLARTQLVICRAGASTASELAAAGRPALLVPYPYAMDDHQMANARALMAAGAGWAIPQSAFSVPLLTNRLRALLDDPQGLAHAAAQAGRFAVEDAAERLASVVLGLLPNVGRAPPPLGKRPGKHPGERLA
ncbi:MAG: undecaprenyldiphospho-muramoylpentapeptide beta-N-acetylglucosaminyltransferase [Thiohalocapsa sp.]